MAQKILFGFIGALLALFVFTGAVFLFTNLIGFQAVAVIELGLSIAGGFFCSKKFSTNKIVRPLCLGIFYGSLTYLVLIFIFKTVIFSLLGGIAG